MIAIDGQRDATLFNQEIRNGTALPSVRISGEAGEIVIEFEVGGLFRKCLFNFRSITRPKQGDSSIYLLFDKVRELLDCVTIEVEQFFEESTDEVGAVRILHR